MPDLPRPGERFDDSIVIASCYIDDDRIGLLRLHDDRPGFYYEVTEYRPAGDGWETTWAVGYENIIPAVVGYDNQFGPWGGGSIEDAIAEQAS